VNRADPGDLGALAEADRQKLLSLPFKLIPARHRLGLVEEDLQGKLLEARRVFREDLPAALAGAVDFFDPDQYNDAASIQDNILFGKIAFGQAQAEARIATLITEALEEKGLADRVVEVGLNCPTGGGGSRLSPMQRQKLALARAILKRPDVFILDNPLAVFDSREQALVRDALLDYFADKGVFWALQNPAWAKYFEHVLVLDAGRLVEHGSYDELAREGRAMHRLLEESDSVGRT
jgi:putative ABC transport system ATP-binding protein